MNTNSNTYTIIYSAILVVVVAGVLALVASVLKPRQQENVALEKKQAILLSANLGTDAAAQADKRAYITSLYEKHITNSYLVNSKGAVVEGDAFSTDLKAQAALLKAIESAKTEEAKAALVEKLALPVFVCTMEDGSVLNIFPCYGPGLWGPIWGYISVKDDFKTIYAASFDHKGETPGLGAEIANPKFYGQFAGKKLEKDGQFHSISIVKGGGQSDNPNGVDAISGGTITSSSLEKAIATWFESYMPYINIKKGALSVDDCSDGCCCSEEGGDHKHAEGHKHGEGHECDGSCSEGGDHKHAEGHQHGEGHNHSHSGEVMEAEGHDCGSCANSSSCSKHKK